MARRLFAVLILTGTIAAVSPASAQTTFVQDHFTVGANTMLEAHAPNTGAAWTRQVGNNGIILNAAAGNARNVGAGDWSIYSNGTIAPAAEIVEGITVTFTNANANNFVDLFGRTSVTLLNAYSARFAANGAVTLTRWNGGAPTTLASAVVAVALNTPISFQFVLKNASKQIWINGVSVASSADNTLAAAGFVALGMNSNVAAQNITDDFFASTFAVTAVDRLDAAATRDPRHTLVEWSTAREVGNLGFRLFRDDGVSRVPVSNGLIAGAALRVSGAYLPAGHTYRFLDQDRKARSARAYWIEEVDLHGHGVWHGPIVPRAGAIDARVAPSATIVDLGQRQSVVTHTRLTPAALSEPPASNRRRGADPTADALGKQWQIAAGDAIKIGVAEPGLYRVARADLVAAGLDPNADPEALRLYADGLEVPIIVDGDAILFYGLPLDTPASGSRIYWLVAGDAGGLRMPGAPALTSAASGRNSFPATVERRDKALFLTFLRDADGDGFVGPVVSTDASQPTSQTLRLQHVDATEPVQLALTLQGGSDLDTPTDHRVAVSFNGHSLGNLSFTGQTIGTATFAVPAASLVDGDNTVSLVAQNGDADISAVVSVAVTYAHTYQADGDSILAVADGGRQTTISGFSTNDVQILDVSNEGSPVRITPLSAAGGTVTFTAPGDGPRTVLAVASSQLTHAASLVRNEPSSLHDAAGADVVIITHPSFVSALAPLVALRESQGLQVMVTKTDDIYDEFSNGAKSPWAIRAFLATAARVWQKPPRYILLVGDASFDERNYLGLGDFDFVPTKLVISSLLTTASDTWFTDFDNDGVADLPIGRLPVRTLDDARVEIGRIVAYETGPVPSRRKLTFVSDADPKMDFHSDALLLEQSVPSGFDVVDVDSSLSGPVAARQQILQGFGDSFIVNYVGHGSVETWSNDTLLGRADLAGLPASTRPPIVVAMTCLNGYFHDVYTESLAEAMLRAPNGAVAVWASSALTGPDAQIPVNEVLLHGLLGGGGTVRLGDAIVAAQKSSNTPDLRQTFILFGDPATAIRPAQ
jgi:hypothetical protein